MGRRPTSWPEQQDERDFVTSRPVGRLSPMDSRTTPARKIERAALFVALGASGCGGDDAGPTLGVLDGHGDAGATRPADASRREGGQAPTDPTPPDSGALVDRASHDPHPTVDGGISDDPSASDGPRVDAAPVDATQVNLPSRDSQTDVLSDSDTPNTDAGDCSDADCDAATACSGVPTCRPDDHDQRECGACGVQSRSCSDTCQWSPWSTCGSEGACTPGETESRECSNGCGSQSRHCQDACTWGAWGDCSRTTADIYLTNDRADIPFWNFACGDYTVFSYMYVHDPGSGEWHHATAGRALIYEGAPLGQSVEIRYACCNVDPGGCNPASTQVCELGGGSYQCLCDGPFSKALTASSCGTSSVSLCY